MGCLYSGGFDRTKSGRYRGDSRGTTSGPLSLLYDSSTRLYHNMLVLRTKSSSKKILRISLWEVLWSCREIIMPLFQRRKFTSHVDVLKSLCEILKRDAAFKTARTDGCRQRCMVTLHLSVLLCRQHPYHTTNNTHCSTRSQKRHIFL